MQTSSEPGRARLDVTPMADVVIVLLLIFIVMTPALLSREIDLPRARHASSQLPSLVLLLRADGGLALGDEPPWPRRLLSETLGYELLRRPPGERDVALRADRGIAYADIRAVLALCREAGAERVALVTQPGAQVER